MAYFGRTAKRPSTKPGAASGNTRADRATLRVVRGVRQAVDRGRQARPGRADRKFRADRSGRSARSRR